MYQIILRTPIDSMIFCLDFVEFQIHADHTQDVGIQNQGYQDISPDLQFTRSSTWPVLNWTSAETCREDTDTMLNIEN